jgi:hypothetical protein
MCGLRLDVPPPKIASTYPGRGTAGDRDAIAQGRPHPIASTESNTRSPSCGGDGSDRLPRLFYVPFGIG